MNMKRLFDVQGFKLTTSTLHKEDRRLSESLTSIGNGYMGMRGNFEETYSGDSHQGSYIAGVWFPDKTKVGWWKNGYPEYFGKVINSLNFIGIGVQVDGEEVDLYVDEVRDFHLELDMQTGMLNRQFILVKGNKETAFKVERFLSADRKEIGAISYTVTPLNYSGEITFTPYLDGNVQNEDSNYEETFWLEIERKALATGGALVSKTKSNPFGTPQFTVAASMHVAASKEAVITSSDRDMYVANTVTIQANEGETVGIHKYISITSSRDYAETEVRPAADKLLEQAVEVGYEALKQAHVAKWLERWEISDVEIAGDDEAQQGIRYNLFQLFATYYGEDSRLNIGPKGFTGEKYGGATYWDTEAYAVPLYLSVADKEVTRNLLLYRHNQLEGAYHNARQQGLKGALYPMVTFTGVECHNEWEITFEEIHRNAAMVYAIYNYVNYTGDKSYLEQFGIEVLVGIARFWADRVHYSKRQGKYMIHGVTGPNEYENNVNNNWYTNFMAKWCLSYTLEVIADLREAGTVTHFDQLEVTSEEQAQWTSITENMYFPYDAELDVFVQHDTFLDKELMPVSELAPEHRPLNQNWSWDRVLRSCFIKQADVLQGIYFHGDQFTMEQKRKNFEFYEPMTVHESSLSPCIHSVLAAELGMEEKAVEMYQRTARLDLDNYNNDTEDGLHITSMTGSWLAIVQGFAGMRTSNETLSFKPILPKGWDHYSFKINYRDRLLKVTVSKGETRLELLRGEALSLKLMDESVLLETEIVKSMVLA
ncbi:glycoside hydrolase family 65 protein [Paenibacillus sp. N1-5-1-14]|uniref:glycoside hydrolase family 65 protein n=1 Tax=Paenibacillus radicibacter TaxID=2972488 RepID=UPI002159772D|nr:glycoside hydrolase family 65 protein [Paenibacillus radicibacter]MCR8643465.1 glycoside hydrolase family 65 protein [Paenibacillus radicibacter]